MTLLEMLKKKSFTEFKKFLLQKHVLMLPVLQLHNKILVFF